MYAEIRTNNAGTNPGDLLESSFTCQPTSSHAAVCQGHKLINHSQVVDSMMLKGQLVCCSHLCDPEGENYPVALHDDVLSPQTCFEYIVAAQSIPALSTEPM